MTQPTRLNRRLALTFLGLASVFSAGLAMAETTLERVKRTGEIRIGYANEAPFAYTEPNGNVTGESPEIVKKIAVKLGIKKTEAVLTEWGGLIPGLQAGRCDVIAAVLDAAAGRLQQGRVPGPIYPL